jgi:hypothetical protein
MHKSIYDAAFIGAVETEKGCFFIADSWYKLQNSRQSRTEVIIFRFRFDACLSETPNIAEGKMKSIRSFHVLLSLLILAAVTMACFGTTAPTPTPVPPDTATPLPPTETPVPTATIAPTATVDSAATQRVEAWGSELEQFADKGYIDMAVGDFATYDDFEEEWAQLGWYQWWELEEEVDSDFMFGAHLKWSTASSTPEESGCGIVFGLQENGDHYSVFLDKSRILFLMSRGSRVYLVGKTRGRGTVSFGNPAEADFQVLVESQKAHVSVNGDITDYTLSTDQTTIGGVALSVLSGTNRDYGTRCEMTDIHIWTPE